MEGLDWDSYFREILYVAARKSKDPSSKFGAIIVDEGHRILSTGYNGLPRGIEYDQQGYFDRPDKYYYWVHAEENAILGAAFNGIAIRDCQMYVISPPCAECTKAIIQAGIYEVIYFEATKEPSPGVVLDRDNWRMSLGAAADMMRRAKVRIRKGEYDAQQG